MKFIQKLNSIFKQTPILFGLLGVFFIPFSFNSISFQDKITSYLFGNSIHHLVSYFDFVQPKNLTISSDSTSFYVLFVLLFGCALIGSIILCFFPKWDKVKLEINQFIALIFNYYLVVIMLKYGFSKLFKSQFYLPEPNILFTPFGQLDKDILYWSTMGLSFEYNILLGLFEIIPAILMLFRKTRTLGLLILFGVLIHVVGVNFSFDISVKGFALFLLLLNFLVLKPTFSSIYDFFIRQKRTNLPHFSFPLILKIKPLRVVLKIFIIGFIFMESLWPFVQNGAFNDDNIERIKFHGAYNVSTEKIGDYSNYIGNKEIKRFFIHRRNYIIFQYRDESMEDFHFKWSENAFILSNLEGETFVLSYTYNQESGDLRITSDLLKLRLNGQAIPWKNLPALKPLFHWSVDQIK